MATRRLHRCPSVLVRVYVHFLQCVWHALDRRFEHQCVCRYACYTGVCDISLHICKHILRTCARVRNLVLALGDEGGGGQLVYTGNLLLTWDMIF